MEREEMTPYLVVGGILLAVALLPPAARVVRANTRTYAPVPIIPDPTVPPPKTSEVPAGPKGPKLQVYVDGKDSRPIADLYSKPDRKQYDQVMSSIWQCGLNLSNLKNMQDWKNWFAKQVSPQVQFDVARALVIECKREKFPLDLAVGHAFAESGCRPAMTANSAGAVGPLQVTPAAAQQLGLPWPPVNPQEAIRIGLKYMKWIRRTYAPKSIVDCLRIYGMGYGGYQRALEQGCPGPALETYSVWKSECGHKDYIYTQRVLKVAKSCPELHTVAWDKWTGRE